VGRKAEVDTEEFGVDETEVGEGYAFAVAAWCQAGEI
jgi:hypothetical protein